MKKITLVSLIFLLLSVPGMAISESDETWPGGVIGEFPKSPAKAHRLEIGFTSYDFEYKEDLPEGYKNTEKGWLGGAYLGYSYQKINDAYFRLFAEYSWGDLTYDGTTMAGTPVIFLGSPQALYRFEFDMGYTFDTGPGRSFCPYIGLGYRYWERGQADITPAYTSYRQEYAWPYIPVGVKAGFLIDDQLSIELHLVMRLMFGGSMTACFSDVDPTREDPQVNLGDTTGLLLEVPVRRRLGQYLFFVVTPWYEYREFDQSHDIYLTENGVPMTKVHSEPAGTTRQFGINLGLGFSF